MPAPLRKPGPVDTSPLFPGLHAELMALLPRLSPEDWNRPTLARHWRVRDIVSHLLDTSMRRLSMGRDGHVPPPPEEPLDSYDAIVRFINRLNAGWLRATERVSPRLLIELLGVVQPQLAAYVATLDPMAPARIGVAWAGEMVSANWFDIGREYTEWWHHQAQIRDAVGAPPLNERHWLYPFLDISMRGLPHAYRDVEAPEGTTLVIRISGDAGGSWCLRREREGDDAANAGGAARWTLWEGDVDDADADARIEMDADTAWRLLFNALPDGAAARLVISTGDQRIARHLLNARSVMV